MVPDTNYVDVKSRMPEIKELFHTRHYVQCASLCEHLLTRSHAQAHPLHVAYLNFYLALAHDTVARETVIRNRQEELDIAEKHYIAALTALTPLELQYSEEVTEFQSPTSSINEQRGSRRRASDATSLHSNHSVSTTATSQADEDFDNKKSPAFDSTEARSNRFVRFSPAPETIPDGVNLKPAKRRPSPIVIPTPKRESSAERRQICANLSSFTTMIKAHLTGVRALRNTPVAPLQRWSFSRSRSSTISSRPESRDSNDDVPSWDKIREERKHVTFRPRFNPASVQSLCRDAINDL
ncbi:hypothetical protein B0J11DRAFT_435343 [Dendryphion nanum]|uniref:Uncharacterized protein n=1 Tax=Dendryphion nanum TaxID=256645 RepID=A0A9P9DRR2_9PLEO|nr:hypothetical protein B0J11DRAFT_435343 [Dendryphion nanum]